MRNKRFTNYPDDTDYTTNANSYYDDLARKQKLVRLLAERIWGYEEILDETLEQIQERFRAWDKNLEDFPEDVKIMLQQWLDDGTLDHIINDTIFNWKLDTSIFEQFEISVNQQLQHIEQLNYNKVSISQFDIPLNKDITNIINALDDNKILVLDDEYFVSEPISLKNKFITGGKLTYTGVRDVEYAIRVLQNSGVYDTKIHIDTPYFAGAIIMKDYTDHPDQFILTDLYVVENLVITNTDVTEWLSGSPANGNVVNGSSVIKVKIDKYKVAAYQKVTNIKFIGICDNGVYVESVLRNEQDNPVYNTTTYQNIQFTSVNCALYVKPTMLSGDIEKARGGIGLQLINFSNQGRAFINRPFFDIQNTEIEGHMVIPWDYYGDRIPEAGTYKTLKSTIILDLNRFPDTKNNNKDVYFTLGARGSGEIYSGLNTFETREVNNELPLRPAGGLGWSIDNIKNIMFKDDDNVRYVGFQFQQSNTHDTKNRTWQIGVAVTGKIVKRKYDVDLGKWTKYQDILSEGNMSLMYYGNRRAGVGVGDMRFDTSKNKPYWWTGTVWVNANGENEFPVDN